MTTAEPHSHELELTDKREQPNRYLCPFCNEKITHITSIARSFDIPRVYHEYHHVDNDCLLSRDKWYFVDDEHGEGKRQKFVQNFLNSLPRSRAEVIESSGCVFADLRTCPHATTAKDLRRDIKYRIVEHHGTAVLGSDRVIGEYWQVNGRKFYHKPTEAEVEDAYREQKPAAPAEDATNEDPLLLEVLNFITRCHSLEIKVGDKWVNAQLERDDLRERAKELYAKLDAVKWGTNLPRRETKAPDGVASQPEAQSAPAMTEFELKLEAERLAYGAMVDADRMQGIINLVKRYRG